MQTIKVDVQELRTFVAEQLRLAADRPLPADRKRTMIRRNVVAWLDERIEGGPVAEVLSDIAITLAVGLAIELTEAGADRLLGFLAEPEPEPVRPSKRSRAKAEPPAEE